MPKRKGQYNDEEAELAFARAFELREKGDPDAVDAFRAALAEYPDESAGWLVLGGLLMRQAEYHEARSCFLNAVRIKPNSRTASQGLFHTCCTSLWMMKR